ncbi:methyltransferase domain-containing protein [Actinomadura macrotermitis]|uniref:Protein-L-isoaspartate O-methyltransferase n=1 Tax=Actinomadura macrotermitis TaxID=2585200 RepID=A0A7K0C1Z7_9ACTN|nr:methyltransferase domain-containing protein [Actinomadura macrotermitis]MQY07495.1 Protein-L-isoaspartate O-methyltransferase [Actinomadura macrotermitis]
MSVPTPGEYVNGLARHLSAIGALTQDEWRDAFAAVPRHLFVPDVAWASPNGPGSPYLVDRAADPVAWWEAVYSDTVLITQYDDGARGLAAGGTMPTSSNSAPSLVAKFLECLSVADGDRILEIGTGTGWTAGLMASCVGAENVTSIEVDESLAKQAADNLESAGHTPHLIVGDGEHGLPAMAPFDRIHATCSVARIPYAWVQQTRPGGVIVVPCVNEFSDGDGHLACLEVGDDGTATGRFPHVASFMMLRGQRYDPRPLASYLHHEDDADKTRTTLDPRTIGQAGYAAEIAIGARVPGCQARLCEADNGSGEMTYWLVTHNSWAVVEYVPGQATYEVEQYGSRRLWDEVAAAHQWWIDAGTPGLDRYGLTVTPEEQYVWLDSPRNLIRAGS